MIIDDRKQIKIPAKTAEILKNLAAKKGISVSVYIQNMVEYCQVNGIDYGNSNTIIHGLIKKEIERVIQIERVFERDYFKPMNKQLSFLFDHLSEAVTSISDEVGEIDNANKTDLNNKLAEVKSGATVLVNDMYNMVALAKEKNQTYIIEISKANFEIYKTNLKNISLKLEVL